MKHQGKILKWNPFLSFCEVEASYDLSKPKKRTVVLEVNLLQTAILMLFNHKNSFVFNEILSELDIEEESLEEVLVSLCSMKYKILKKSDTSTRNIKHNESFSVDENFRPKLKKISITSVSKKQSQIESEETHVRVLEDRKYLLEALIVQQMKKHNKMEHTTLINEIFSKVKFPLTHNVIKDRIESLISREYMEIISKMSKKQENKHQSQSEEYSKRSKPCVSQISQKKVDKMAPKTYKIKSYNNTNNLESKESCNDVQNSNSFDHENTFNDKIDEDNQSMCFSSGKTMHIDKCADYYQNETQKLSKTPKIKIEIDNIKRNIERK